LEFTSFEDVKNHAVVAAGEILRDQGLHVWSRRYYMFVADENNRTRLKLGFDVEDLTNGQD
jgi:hypothetical protein